MHYFCTIAATFMTILVIFRDILQDKHCTFKEKHKNGAFHAKHHQTSEVVYDKPLLNKTEEGAV